MEIVDVTLNNADLLKTFVQNLGTASESFRYFNSRSIEVIKSHLATFLILEENKPVAYGHLDVEDETVWLGICVLPGCQNKGYGKMIMSELVNAGKRLQLSRIKLAVDKSNITAINLYEKFHFQKEKEFESYYQYSLKF